MSRANRSGKSPEDSLAVEIDADRGQPEGIHHPGQAAVMRVALNSYFWGSHSTGSGQYLHNLLPNLADLQPTTSYVLLGPAGDGTRPADVPGHPQALRTPFDRSNADLAKVWFEQVSFPRACRQVGANVAHVPYFAAPLLPTVPTVVTIHDVIPLLLPAYRASRAARAYFALVARSARRASLVITDSEASARDIVRLLRVPRERLRVIYLAADAAFRPVPPEARDGVLRRLGLPNEYLLYLGGYDTRKNVILLLEAFARSRERLHGLPLVLAGRLPERDSPFVPDPRPVIARLGIENLVILPGWVDEADKPALYSAATAFVFPSAYEGFGLPVLEALSCGTPAIIAAGSSLEEVAGPGGLVVPSGDAAALSGALEMLATDGALRAGLSEAGLQQAQRFSWKRTAAQTLAAYEQAIRPIH